MNKNTRNTVLLMLLLGVLIAIFFLAGTFSTRVIAVNASGPTISATPTSQWTMIQKIAQANSLIAQIPLRVSSGSFTFNEARVSPTGSITTKTFNEPNRQVALAIMNQATGVIQAITVTIQGDTVIAPAPWQIKMVTHPDGITFNYWNTAYQITSPAGYVVIRNDFPNVTDTTVYKKVKNSKGKLVTVAATQRTINDVLYTPDSPDLETPLLVATGKDYLASLSFNAAKLLAQRGVMSRASPGTLVSSVPQLPLSFNEHLPLLEQSDYTDFLFAPGPTFDRVFVLLGANGDDAWNLTCNTASACGLYQFTAPTWNSLRTLYPKANLPTFAVGAQDHMDSAMAAMLLYDYNLSDLVHRYGSGIMNDPHLEEYLAAEYNGTPAHVIKAINTASILSTVVNWFDSLTQQNGGLVTQQREYIAKLDYLRQNNIPN